MSLHDIYMILTPPALVNRYSLILPLCLLRFLITFCRRPHSLHVQSLLNPLHFCNPRIRPLYRLLAEVHNWSRHNALCNLIINTLYICLYLLKPRLLHHRLHWGVLPNYVQKLPGLTPYNTSIHLVLKPVGSYGPLIPY